MDKKGGGTVLDAYPNLQAILDGRVSGHYTEWPMVRAELRRLIESLTRSSIEAPKGSAMRVTFDRINELEAQAGQDGDWETAFTKMAQRANTLSKLLDDADSRLASAKEATRCTCYTLPHARDCGVFVGITQAGDLVRADDSSVFTDASIEAAALIYEDCRTRGQSPEVSLRKALKRLISTASAESYELRGSYAENLDDKHMVVDASYAERLEEGLRLILLARRQFEGHPAEAVLAEVESRARSLLGDRTDSAKRTK